ncbi:hypothetical protein EJB05_53638, partial [Eragrostis curvula]
MANRSARRRRANQRRRAAAAPSPTVSSNYPRSVLLHFYSEPEADNETASCRALADPRTTAAARSTMGHPFRVSFNFAPPPEVSLIIAGFPDGAEKHGKPVVLAAHGDSVLFRMYFTDCLVDHFVYNAGGPSTRPPTVSLLPPYYLTGEELEKHFKYTSYCRCEGPVHRSLDADATGLLRHREDEFVVAELKMVVVSTDTPKKKVPELLLLRSGEWSVQRPMVVNHAADETDMEELLSSWKTRCVLPLADGLLCWYDVSDGLLFCNVLDEVPELRYVPLPVNPYCSNVSVTAGGGALKLVNICPRCCCGGKGATRCDRSRHAYTIHTWILRIQDMAWEMDGMVDSTEIWALDAYKGIPRVHPFCPYASLDEPHIICFVVCEIYVVNGGDTKEWLVMLDLRRKRILSACRCRNRCYGHHYGKNIFPSRISDCFNPLPSSRTTNSTCCASSKTENHGDMVAPPVEESRGNNDGSIRESTESAVDAAMQLSEILATFQEIPNYHDVLKAINILSHGQGRRIKALLELPISLRRDWLLMEIKASEA